MKLADPRYGAPVKEELVSPEATEAVRAVVTTALRGFLMERPALLEELGARCRK